MAFNGSGVFQRLRKWVDDAAAGVKIRADYHDSEDDGFAAGLSNTICRDGQSTITQNIPFNGKRITNLGDPVNPQDALTKAFAAGSGGFVAKAGDRMSGTLTVDDALPNAGYPKQLTAQFLSTRQSLGFNAYVRESGGGWNASSAGYSSYWNYDASTGNLNWGSTTASSAGGATISLNPKITFDKDGYISAARFTIDANMWLGMSGVNPILVFDNTDYISYSRSADTMNFTIGGSIRLLVVTTGVTNYTNVWNSAGTAVFQTGGANRMHLDSSGGMVVYASTTTHTINVQAPSTAVSTGMAIFATGSNMSGSGAVYGLSGAIVGALGYNAPSQGTWSIWGNNNAYLAAGAWQTSDANLKIVSGGADINLALANVMAVPVMTYQPVRVEGVDDGETPEDKIGWLAQDIETRIPCAVREVGVPTTDLLTRAKLAGVPLPEEDSDEAKALAEPEMSVRAVNLYFLVAELWAAVQALNAKITELEARP